MDDTTRKRPRSAAAHSPKPGGPSLGGDGHSAAASAAAAAALDRARALQLRKSRRTSPDSSSNTSGSTSHPGQQEDYSQRNAVLNDLLRVSSAHDKNYALSSDEIVRELVRIAVCDCLGWNVNESDSHEVWNSSSGFRLNLSPNPHDKEDDAPILQSQRCWIEPPTRRAGKWAEHWRVQLGRNKTTLDAARQQTLEVILVVIRNLTFVAANLRLLAYSPDVIHLLVGCLYEGTDNYYGSEDASASTSLAYSAIHALLNLAPYLDVSGQRLCSDRLFYKPAADSDEGPKVPDAADAYGQAVGGRWGWGGLWLAKRLDTKEDSLSDVSRDFILSLASDYLVAVWSIFPALTHVLTNPRAPRSVVLLALDFLLELVNAARAGMVGTVKLQDDPDTIPSLRQILVSVPDPLLERLLGLLYVPRLGPDSLEYLDPVNNVVTRVTTLKLLSGYDATVDTEVRDRVLELLVPLMELDSPRMAGRMGRNSRGQVRNKLYDSVVPILSTTVGRQEASGLAMHFFRELSAAPENRVGFLYVQDRLVELASRDSRVSSLVWNHLYVSRTSDTSTDDEGDSDDDDDDDSTGNDSDDGTDRAMDESAIE